MVRLIVYALLGFLLWRILQSVGRLMNPRPPRQAPPPGKKTPPDFSNVKDAEFEDLTPKKEGEAGRPTT
jgi:hypothetical protein